MYKLYSLPSPRAEINELADFAEIECLRKGQVSRREVTAALGRLEDDIYEGDHIDDPLESELEDVFSELDQRKKFCNNCYPFLLDDTGQVLRLDLDLDQKFVCLYIYLLLSTRLNMKTDRVHAGIDGTLLFEKISGEIAKNFLGDRSQSYVFGTSTPDADFEAKVNELCDKLKEGNGFINRNDSPATNIKDDTLDVVAWKAFKDKKPGQLIAFGQCKTGTTWKTHLKSLQPDEFCMAWFKDLPSVLPIRMFFLCEALLRTRWYTTTLSAGILFDRCRIMDYSQIIPDDLSETIETWNEAALATHCFE